MNLIHVNNNENNVTRRRKFVLENKSLQNQVIFFIYIFIHSLIDWIFVACLH